MAALKPWYKVAIPREDLREGKPLDAAEFAVHLDQVREGQAKEDYQNPQRFFARTFLTKNLTEIAGEVIRRLSGIQTETSAVFNMSTQFGGGKTHALTLMYHLASHGPEANGWMGVGKLLARAGVGSVPKAKVATFVGTEFDSTTGRGGDDGTPRRRTPWGEIAWQLGGAESFALVEEHEKQGVAPGGDVIRKMLSKDQPCLILMDELMNYVCRYRKSGLSDQFYTFLHNLSETARNMNNVVLAVSIPASEMEMTAQDLNDFARFKKLLDRLGKPVVMSSEGEGAEIIRRRLFEWEADAVSAEGRILLDKEAEKTCREYAAWVLAHRNHVPQWFPVDHAREAFAATYPFHPMVLSVFERKWQSLPRFQQTRGILRLLAQWVSHAYQDGFRGAHRDALIGLGTAPLSDSLFRRAVLEQLGEDKLETAITTDICGKKDSFAIRLDRQAVDTIRKARLHQKVATSIFFESSGGQASDKKDATLPEIRLAVAEPSLDIGNVETVLEALTSSCYYLTVEKNRYRYSLTPNLNKILSDRRASVDDARIDRRIKDEVRKVFSKQVGVERIYFPEKSSEIPDIPAITLVVMSPERTMQDHDTLEFLDKMTREHGSSGRTFKSALVWSVPEGSAELCEQARTMLALEDIEDEEVKSLDEAQKSQLSRNLQSAKRDMTEAVWRTYKYIALLGRENQIETVDLGLLHSSASTSMADYILHRLIELGYAEKSIGAGFLVRKWPPAFVEWSTKSVRDAFYASPKFPRLLNPEQLKQTIARGVSDGQLAYVGKDKSGKYDPFFFESDLEPDDIEFSDEMYIVRAEDAKKHIEPPRLKYLKVTPEHAVAEPGKEIHFAVQGLDQFGERIAVEGVKWHAEHGSISQDGTYKAGDVEGADVITVRSGEVTGTANITIRKNEVRESEPGPVEAAPKSRIVWHGQVPHLKLMNFYTKVLARFAREPSLKVEVQFEVSPENFEEHLKEIRRALKDLGLNDNVQTSDK